VKALLKSTVFALVVGFMVAGCDLEALITDPAETDPVLFAVYYNGNGETGGNVPTTGLFAEGDLVTAAENTGDLEKTGYTFAGWNTATDGTGLDRLPGSTFTMGSANVNLYAKWTEVVPQTASLLVAVDALGNAYHSVDGSTWSGPIATGLTTGNGIAFASGVFVAIGQDGTNYGLAVSEDGITWAKQNLGGASALLNRIAVNPAGEFMALGIYGASAETFWSSDGLNWTGPIAESTNWVGPAWAGDKWFITNSNGTTWRSSTDGTSWTTTGGTGGLYQMNTLIGVNGNLIVGGGAPSNTNKQTRTSTDGAATFSATVNVSTAAYYVNSFAADPVSNRVLLAGSGTTAQAAYSDNYGASWTIATGTGTGTFRAAVHWKNGFLIGDNTGTVYSSADGVSFSVSATLGASEIRGIAYNGAP
jgi:uncharacterized repeat protein (TIGR02543 family)